MLCTKIAANCYLVSDIINSQYVKRIYQGYTKAQALKQFRAYKKQIQQNWVEYLTK
jgi:hypothetical protein